jgi:hypothetical protein
MLSPKATPIFESHLHNAAYFFASAVWNEDSLGADRFRDLLLRWMQPFYPNLRSAHLFSHTLLLTPDLLSRDWTGAHSEVKRLMRFEQEALPGPVFGLLLLESHYDVVCTCGLVALHWYANSEQPSETAARAAILTLRREKREFDGSDLTETWQKTTFRMFFDFAIRYALNPRFDEARYSATIDGLVQFLTNIASPRMVSGRVYGGWGIDGFGTLRPVLLAAMVANLPAQGDDGIAVLIDDLKNDPLFQDDETVRNFIYAIGQMSQALTDAEGDEVFKKAAHTCNKEIALTAGCGRLREILAQLITAFEALRKERLRSAPLDEDRVDLVRQAMTKNVLAFGPSITCFQNFPIRRDDSGKLAATEHTFGVIPKGAFTIPKMSVVDFDELPQLFVLQIRELLTAFLWRSMYHRPKRVVSINISEGTEAFWRHVTKEASTVGPDPMVLVPFEPFGDEIAGVAQAFLGRGLVGFSVSHASNMPTGGGVAYVGTIDSVNVYSAQAIKNEAVLCSRHLVREINYGVVHAEADIIDFAFVDCDDPDASYVRLSFAQDIQWPDYVFVEYKIISTEVAQD